MEIRRKKTLAGLLLQLIVQFCVGTVLLLLLLFFFYDAMIRAGTVLPANYAERQIQMEKEQIKNASKVTEAMIPSGCVYGVYDGAGKYQYGTFSGKDIEQAWEYYQKSENIAGKREYYTFLVQKNGNLCIVKYYLASQFSLDILNKYLPSPEFLWVIIFIVLFLVQTILLSRRTGKRLSKRLKILKDMTEKVEKRDLEFQEAHSDIREIDEVLTSLYDMKCALESSLKNEWEQEQQKKEQIAALVHDIKTPLTVIRGNAELLKESGLPEQTKTYNEYVLNSVEEIEEYMKLLRGVLNSETVGEKEKMDAEELTQQLVKRTKRLAESAGVDLCVDRKPIGGRLEGDKKQLLRAWDNIVSNGLQRTKEHEKVKMEIRPVTKTGEAFLSFVFLDQGEGFTEEALKHGKEQFYQGDASRHEKKHQGLGLYIVDMFVKDQGGEVLLENADEPEWGGKVTMLLKMIT